MSTICLNKIKQIILSILCFCNNQKLKEPAKHGKMCVCQRNGESDLMTGYGHDCQHGAASCVTVSLFSPPDSNLSYSSILAFWCV